MLNFLYCFDKNYNQQAFNSIYSLLQNSKSKFNLFIIHKEPQSFVRFKKQIESHENLNQLNIFKFKSKLHDQFPRLSETHVSEATYYRLFIDEYLPDDLDFITYLDADIICVKSPENLLSNHINFLRDSKYIISVKTESLINSEIDETKIRLGLSNDKYFNAGVKIIDYQKWKQDSTSLKLQNKLNQIYDKIYFWDQDVLNSYFDGNYFELSKFLNFNLYLTSSDYFDKTSVSDKKDMIFIHYAGSFKPWTIRGILNPKSKYYQRVHYELNQKFHIVHTWRRDSLLRLIIGIITLRIFHTSRPIKFMFQSIYSLVRNEKK